MPNTLTRREEEDFSPWEHLPDDLVFQVFSSLPVHGLVQASEVCKQWYRVAQDEFLWRHLFQLDWKVDTAIPMVPYKKSWKEEYIRLYYHTPMVESEVLREHRDQVLHVSYSHNGKMFATTSKDGFIKVWTSSYPATVKYYADMKEFTWKYTQSSQFNMSDTLLLVSGVHFGSHSTSGEIAVFCLKSNPDGLELQSRVLNKPYDIFGTWYNETCLLSGNLHWLGHLTSCSVLWLNKATQALQSEHEPVVLRLFKFRNVNASSIRTIMIAKCHDAPTRVHSDSKQDQTKGQGKKNHKSKIKTTECSQGKIIRGPNAPTQKMQLYCDENRIQLLEVDDSSLDGSVLNGTIEYNQSYRLAETGSCGLSSENHVNKDSASSSEIDKSSNFDLYESLPSCSHHQKEDFPTSSEPLPSSSHQQSLKTALDSKQSSFKPSKRPRGAFTLDLNKPISMECEDDTDSSGDESDEGMMSSSQSYEEIFDKTTEPLVHTARDLSAQIATAQSIRPQEPKREQDKYLIFTTGRKTYTPHQIGIKRIKHEDTSVLTSHRPQPCSQRGESTQQNSPGESAGAVAPPLPNAPVEPEVEGVNDIEFDSVDHLIELHGHIIGMCLSPDERYLYVNSRPWPQGYEIEEPLYPPPIAQEIDIHVIDLQTMQEVGTMHRAHKAYTPNDECFFIFLDVCDEYVASGAEDRHGYLWDRHYGVCLTKYPHNDVVNCVAFNSADPEVLVTVSDDNTVKIWRSRRKMHLLKVRGKLT